MYLALIALSAGIAAYVFDSATVVKVVALVGALVWLYVMLGLIDRISSWMDRCEAIAKALSDKIGTWWKW
jgi:hypothetical protein